MSEHQKTGRDLPHWSPPLPGSIKIIQGWGASRDYRANANNPHPTHKGVDIRAAEGTSVLAIGSGKVIAIHGGWKPGDGRAGGNTITIEHPGGIRSQYMHLSEIVVKPGDPVEGGGVIGKSGVTGGARAIDSTAKPMDPHLHLQILTPENGTWVLIPPNDFVQQGHLIHDMPEHPAGSHGGIPNVPEQMVHNDGIAPVDTNYNFHPDVPDPVQSPPTGDGYTGHPDLPLVSEGLGPLPFVISGLGAAAKGLEAQTVKDLEKALGEVVKDWAHGQVEDLIIDHLIQIDHSSTTNSTQESLQPSVDAGTQSGGMPQDIPNNNSHSAGFVPSQGHESYLWTPSDANQTDPQGYAGHSSSSNTSIWDPSQGHDNHSVTSHDVNQTDPQGHAADSSSSNISIWDPSQGHDNHNWTPSDANQTDLQGHSVHVDASNTSIWDPSQGHDTHNVTPPDANMTDQQGYAVHVDASIVGYDPGHEMPSNG